jgi:hypothetical protein
VATRGKGEGSRNFRLSCIVHSKAKAPADRRGSTGPPLRGAKVRRPPELHDVGDDDRARQRPRPVRGFTWKNCQCA